MGGMSGIGLGHGELVELVRKYNRPGPRYTSYPTALAFTEEVGAEELLVTTEEETGPLSLYFHLPFCETLCWFCGCNTIITRDYDQVGEYLGHLEREMDLYGEWSAAGRPVEQLHFGGGTPNFFPPARIRELGAALHRRFRFADDAECSVELAPSTLEREHVAAFAEIGMNRASFGIQDTNPEVQKNIHRIQPHAKNRETMGWLREHGFASVNIDLIYGLPGQTVESFRRTLDDVMELEPDRIAVFNYAHVPWIRPAQKILERSGLPDAETRIGLLTSIFESLSGHGFVMIGLDHFARPGDELVRAREERTLQRNFQGYSTRGGREIAAFGVSSISQTTRAYRQNHKDLVSYRAALGAGRLPVARGLLVSREDRLRREAIHRILCDLELDRAAFGEKWGIDFGEFFAHAREPIEELREDGLLEEEGALLRVTPAGRLFLRNIGMALDPNLPAGAGRYSRTV